MSRKAWARLMTFFAVVIGFCVGVALLSPRTYAADRKISHWVSSGWEVEIVTSGGAVVSARGNEEFKVVETFESGIVPGGIVLEGERADDGHFVAAAQGVEPRSTFLMAKGTALLTVKAEGKITLRVWPSRTDGSRNVAVVYVIVAVMAAVVFRVMVRIRLRI